MTPSAFAALFLSLLLLTVLARGFLMLRQIKHVAAARAQVPAPFADSISLASHQKAADYTRARMRLGLVDVLVSALFAVVMTVGGGLSTVFDLSSAWFEPNGIAHGVALLAVLGLLGWLLDLPFTVYRIFVVERGFGFNRMTAGLFIADTLRSATVTAVIGLPVLVTVLWLMGAMGDHWWLWVWLVWLAFNLLASLIWPTFIAPLFNKFTPLADEALKTRVERLLARCGFRAQGLFVMDGSRRSAHGNAYFTGFGAAKRIVFFDTLLDKLRPEEVEAVLAHELGHFHHRHIWKRLAVIAALSLAMLWLLAWLMHQAWFFAGLGMDASGTATALALFSLTLPVFAFPVGPLMSRWSRAHEFEADRYAATQTHAEDLVSALVKLYRDNAATLTPDPLYSAAFDSHPPATVRVARLRAHA
ncbi:MAG TPA: M48 family metallopeptidase [Rhodocyclaceae bacterium]|nr:M48 family metallopeptidase [Rhodocyclaceae bacterium]